MSARYLRISASAAIALAFAGQAYAQDLCGGIGVGGQWIGGDESASDISVASTYQEQMALVLGGNQHISLFTLSQPTTVRLEAQGRGAGDPMIDLYNETGAVIMSDDDSGGMGASRIETDLAAGTYCLAMRSFDNSPMTGFVRVGTMAHEPLTEGFGMSEPTNLAGNGGGNGGGSSCNSARMVAMGVPATASKNETEFWGFTIDEPAGVVITAESDSADPFITLYDPYGDYITENDDWDGLNSRIELSYVLDPGDYCIAMDALSDSFAPITVLVEEYDEEAIMRAMYDRGEAAPPLDGSYPVAGIGVLETRLRKDLNVSEETSWIAFDVNESGLVLVEVIAITDGDPYITLFDELGREIAYNDDYGQGLDSLLTARVTPGTYLLAVGDLNGFGSKMRMLMERYVPAQ